MATTAHRRGILLINKKFQLRFAAYVCVWVVAISFIYPILFYGLFDYVKQLLGPNAGTNFGVALENARDEFTLLLLVFQGVLLALTFMISIFMSHRIAGPLYKLSRFFAEAAKGHFNDDLLFRKRDHFKDLADDYNIMMRGIRQIHEEKSDAILTAIPRLEKVLERHGQAISSEVKTELETALAALRDARG